MTELKPRISTEDDAGNSFFEGPFDQVINSFAAATVRAKGIDPMITELVRLRCAQVHDCRLCGSLRSPEALAMGLDEDMAAAVARYEESTQFGDAAIAALRLCDAIILTPGAVGDDLAGELHRHFDDAQIAELCLDVMKWSQQKVLVSLRIETPPAEISKLSFDEDGEPVFGGPVSAG